VKRGLHRNPSAGLIIRKGKGTNERTSELLQAANKQASKASLSDFYLSLCRKRTLQHLLLLLLLLFGKVFGIKQNSNFFDVGRKP